MNVSEKDINVIFGHTFFENVDRDRSIPILQSAYCEICSFEEGEIILSPANAEKKLGIVLEGCATVNTKDPSRNTLLRILREGDLFGVSNLFTNEPFVSVIRAKKKCRIFFFHEKAVRSLLESDRSFLYHYLAFLSGRVCFLNRKISYLTAGSAERRLTLYLAGFEKNEILLPTSLSSLSEVLDVGRASLYRAFDRLTEDGYIQKEGRKITILHPEAMLKAYE